MPYRLAAKESVGYYATWTLGPGLDPSVDIASWVFKATFERFAGDPQAFTLNMASTTGGEGFRIWDGPGHRITCRILAATLAAISDTTGQFLMTADLLATPPSAARFFVADLELTVLRGPTA